MGRCFTENITEEEIMDDIPFAITDIADDMKDEKVLAEVLRTTLIERIKEGEEGNGVDHKTVMNDARQIITSAQGSKVKWVIQNTLVGDKNLGELSNAIVVSGASIELIDLAPFSEDLHYKYMDERKPVIYGSTTFMLLAYQHEYLSQGVFYDESSFLMSEYIKRWGRSVLNNDAVIVKAGEVNDLKYDNDQTYFIRPNDDYKAFAGSLMSFHDIKKIIDGVIDENPYITPDTELVLCSPKRIGKEWRNIIIQGRVISSCRYRFYGEQSIDEDDAPADMIDFVEALCGIFTPHDVFVMDVCECEGEYFVIECNCFNGSGIYSKDISKIVNAVNAYIEN